MEKKYIDAERLTTIIEERKVQQDQWINSYHEPINQGISQELTEILSIISSLQQERPEVDLQKEVKSYIKDNFTITDEVAQIPEEDRMYSMGQDDMMAFAKHVYELGLNARKEKL